MLSQRRRLVLQALIEEYIMSAIPVGSRTLVERHALGVSPATVRNELSILEAYGYVTSPHVSAGRIPTDAGYRTFVDGLLADSRPEWSKGDISTDAALQRELEMSAQELDDLIRETSQALTRFTRCLAIVLAPCVSTVALKKISLVAMGESKVIVVLVTEDGQVFNRHIEFALPVSTDEFAAFEGILNSLLAGKSSIDGRVERDVIASKFPDDPLLLNLIDQVLECLDEAGNDRVHHGGLSALLTQPEFHNAQLAVPVVQLLDDNLTLLHLLGNILQNEGTVVSIGHENENEHFNDVSVVASRYGQGSAEGVVAVVGPTRMDYARAIDAVRVASRVLDDTLIN